MGPDVYSTPIRIRVEPHPQPECTDCGVPVSACGDLFDTPTGPKCIECRPVDYVDVPDPNDFIEGINF